MSRQWHGRDLTYRTRARPNGRPSGRVRVRVSDDVARPRPLDEFLTYRWGLHERGPTRSYYLPNVHPVWTFRGCDLLDRDASLLARAGVAPVRAEPDSVLYAPGVPVRFGTPVPLPKPGRTR